MCCVNVVSTHHLWKVGASWRRLHRCHSRPMSMALRHRRLSSRCQLYAQRIRHNNHGHVWKLEGCTLFEKKKSRGVLKRTKYCQMCSYFMNIGFLRHVPPEVKRLIQSWDYFPFVQARIGIPSCSPAMPIHVMLIFT